MWRPCYLGWCRLLYLDHHVDEEISGHVEVRCDDGAQRGDVDERYVARAVGGRVGSNEVQQGGVCAVPQGTAGVLQQRPVAAAVSQHLYGEEGREL